MSYDDEDELMELYQQVILDHSRNPRNFREPASCNCLADGHNPLCGDKVRVFLDIQDGLVRDAAFQGSGCAICTASASMMTQLVKDQPLEKVEALFQSFHRLLVGETSLEAVGDQLGKLAVFAGVCKYPVRVKCATLPWHTLKAGLDRRQAPVSTE